MTKTLTCGKAYCEHHPEGLPVCAKCREESALAHDRACAELAEARADADHWKSECNALQRMVHESRAEIDGLTLMATNASMEPARRLIQKNKELHAVIEQMREALENIRDYPGHIDYTTGEVHSMQEIAIAALAAERGE